MPIPPKLAIVSEFFSKVMTTQQGEPLEIDFFVWA